MKKKERIDKLLAELGHYDSREKAKRAVMAGLVYIDEVKIDKAGTEVPVDANIILKDSGPKYVSRGGLKLEKAIKNYGLDLTNKVCMDIGSSTGGFTDCMLQNGATKVYSVDVGYGQLDWKLRNDSRVVCMEKTNIRYVTREDIDDDLDFVSIDVSFISLRLVLPVAKALLKESGQIVFLIKPQFEAGREQVKKNGVVRDKKVHVSVLEKTLDTACKLGFSLKELTYSPITGPKGNMEFLAYCSIDDESPKTVDINSIKRLVDAAHEELVKK